jgi:hypothetical protein
MRTCSSLLIIYLFSCLIPDAYETGGPVTREDINRMTAGYLINPVEPVFNAWQERPREKQIPFDAFCEEIRPCRAGSVLYRTCPKRKVYRKMSVEPFNKIQPEQGNPWKNETPKELLPP